VEYLVVIEKGETSYGAYVPDLPGCVAVGETRREVLKLIREGLNSTSRPCAKRANPSRHRRRRANSSKSAPHNNRFERSRGRVFVEPRRGLMIRINCLRSATPHSRVAQPKP
jgi:hypothetical protein